MPRLPRIQRKRQQRRDAVGPSMPAPRWPDDAEGGSGPLRVLVEHPEPATRHYLERGLRSHGFRVLTCGGPETVADAQTACPVLVGQACPAVDDADVIISSLHVTGGPEGLVVQRIAEDPNRPAMILEATDWQVEKAFGRADHVTHQYPFRSVDDVVAAIENVRPTAFTSG